MGELRVRVLDRSFVIEWGKVAPQADGAVLVRENETVVLVTVVADRDSRPAIDFFPLTVEYRERFSAVGRFPGGYRKREGAASNHEILCSRLIDRSIRPLFPDGFRCETQVLATVLAADPDGDPALLGVIGASAALQLSGIPWEGPVAAVRIGRSADGALSLNPPAAERATPSLDLVASLTREGLVMLEARAGELPEADLLAALNLAAAHVAPLLDALEQMRAAGKPKRLVDPRATDPHLHEAVERASGGILAKAVSTVAKQERAELLRQARDTALATLATEFAGREGEIAAAIEGLTSKSFRAAILDEGKRADGRSTTQVRPIQCEVGLLPRVHGSALFTRGETQALVVCTLGTARDEQEVEGLGGVEREAFQLYYRFPSYSVGEVRPLRGPGRREIGHGNLAQRALQPALPSAERFPYTIKIESEITSSNGSSSMASVCGGCLALMDAGVPLRRPVAGIAMGLIRDGERTAILSDILGDEDHLGDMDFKVAGTEEGVTAVQLDNKLGSVAIPLLEAALGQAREGRLHILREMAKAIACPRASLSPHAPRVQMLKIGTHRIRDLIGAGGRVIQAVQADTGSKIDVSDDGSVRIYTQDAASLDQALRRVRDLTGEPEVGKSYRGTVTGVKEFGLFVRLFEGIEGLVHVTELAQGEIRDLNRAFAPGDEMIVKVLGVDGQGKIKLSRRQAGSVSEGEIGNA